MGLALSLRNAFCGTRYILGSMETICALCPVPFLPSSDELHLLSSGDLLSQMRLQGSQSQCHAHVTIGIGVGIMKASQYSPCLWPQTCTGLKSHSLAQRW